MYRFILVEDDYNIRTGLSNFFPWNSIGFKLLQSFENGKKALDFLLVNQVDVVLTDIKMPVMDGLSLAKQLKTLAPDTLVIFLSSYRSFEYAQEALNYGVRNYIVKSTKYDVLIEIFKTIHSDLDQKKSSPPPQEVPIPGSNHRIIKQIIDLIQSDISMSSLQSLADVMQLNPVYLSRFFKEKTGINFSDYLTQQKMETASTLLKETDHNIFEISELVGYSNDKNFSRAFKKYYGIPPAVYRNFDGEKV